MSVPIEQPLLVNDSIKESVAPPETLNTLVQPMTNQTQPVRITMDEEVAQHKPPRASQPSVFQQPTTEQQPRSFRKFTVIQVLSLVCGLIGLVFVFAIPPLIQSMIIQQSKDQVILAPANQGLWAHFPGDSQTIILRNFTFFSLNNQQQFLLFGQKPSFKQISGFKIQQIEDFLNITYLQNGNLVKVRDWTRFGEWPESRSLDEKVNILNMGNLGYWATLKKARTTLLLQQGLATLFVNLQQSILPTIIGQGISQQFLTNVSTTYYSLLAPAGIDELKTSFLWEDPAYGLSDKQNVGTWAVAAANCFKGSSFSFSNESILIKNYFSLTDRQTEYLMRKINSYVLNLNRLLIQNHYCYGIDQKDCTGRYLSVAQLAESFVTYNTPPVSSIQQTYSICDDNSTCNGKYPELYAFYKNVYQPKMHKQDSPELSFSRATVLKWFQYDRSYQTGKDYNTAENCLLHIGNLDTLWQWGQLYDQTKNLTNLDKIKTRFELESLQHTKVFWEWLKYLANDFVLQNAGNVKLGISTLFTQALYQQFSYLQDNLQPLLLTQLLRHELQSRQCHVFFEKSLDLQADSAIVDKLCQKYVDIHSLQFAQIMYNVCEKKFAADWQQLQKRVGVLAMQNYCDAQAPEGTLGRILHNNKLKVSQMYDCASNTNTYCSNFQLALLQWQKSQVTLQVPPELTQIYQPSTTFATWDSNFPPFEYWHFIQKFPAQQQTLFPVFTIDQLFKKFTFQQWFSLSVVLSELRTGVHPYFMKYIRYVCIKIGLTGFTTTRSPRQILFGYEDPFLKQVKQAYPPFGGDPSAPSLIAFNELNITEAEANQIIVFETGKDDFRKVYQNHEINGYRYLVNNYTFFDGNQTRWEWRSPWAQKDYFYGTTAKIFAPNQFEADNMSLLITQVQRYGSNHFYGDSYQKERFGVDVYISYLNKKIGEVSAENDKYYQTLPNIFNVSSIFGLPLYVAKNHFMNCTEWLDRVDIYDEQMNIHYQETSRWDDSFILVEPYTGVSFQSFIYLQNNYFHQPDQLYDYPVDTFLPIFSICRSGNITQQKVRQYFDPLLAAFTLKEVVLYVGLSLTLLSIISLAFVTYKKRQLLKKTPQSTKQSHLGISLQNMEQLDSQIQQTITSQKQL